MMHKLLQYPFDSKKILRKRKSIKKEIINNNTIIFTEKKIAILGGSTTHDIKEILELFLLNNGIKPTFYESEYAQYWQDVMFDNKKLDQFNPDIIYIHTSNRNIMPYPSIKNSIKEIDIMLDNQYHHFMVMWNKISEKYNCPIIQNNFEMPHYRLMGNKDAIDFHGRTNFITRLNQKLYEYTRDHNNLFINDINYLSACYGLNDWSNVLYWHMYKYSLAVPAIPELTYNISNIVKSIFGKNKKALMLDLDNTLWGGVIGDDGIEGIEIGNETSMGQVYSEFQQYIKDHKDLGVILTINSKNDHENALKGLNHPQSILKEDDFIVIKANWQNKDINAQETISQLNIGDDSVVFVDDNPVERDLVTAQLSKIIAPNISKVENYINIIDKSGYFEVSNLSNDDIQRNEMYKSNLNRVSLSKSFSDYNSYLISLEMTAEIKSFEKLYLQRITQLINKTNQFNLTTKRLNNNEVEAISCDNKYITLYGKLTDKFGDNGIVSIITAKKDDKKLHIDLWLMSCRIFKRNMEYAMIDALIKEAKKVGIETIYGYYCKTSKNNMVKTFYKDIGFTLINQSDNESSWKMNIKDYKNQNNLIKIK